MHLLMVAGLLLAAQAQPAQPPPCSAPEHRQFDFWIGQWVVHGPNGREVGANRIDKVENGCALQENWTSATGTTGRSLNFYEPLTKRWTQAWAGAGGSLLLLQGGYDGEKMVLEGKSLGASGAVRDRVTWSRLPGGKVRQFWEQSADDGMTWSVAFEGTYSRKP